MNSHELAKILLSYPDTGISIRNAAGDMGGDIEEIRFVKDGGVEFDTESLKDENIIHKFYDRILTIIY